MGWQRCLAVAINIPEDLPASSSTSSGLRTKISVNPFFCLPPIFICSHRRTLVSVFFFPLKELSRVDFFVFHISPRLINYESRLHRKNDIYSLEHAGILFNFPITQLCLLLLNTWQLGILATPIPLQINAIIFRFHNLSISKVLNEPRFCKTD